MMLLLRHLHNLEDSVLIKHCDTQDWPEWHRKNLRNSDLLDLIESVGGGSLHTNRYEQRLVDE